MAIHLLLLAVNKVNPGLNGSVTIYSDCQRALGSVEDLPTLKIPTRYKHSDILKNILLIGGALVNRSNFQTSPIPPKFWVVIDIYDNKKS